MITRVPRVSIGVPVRNGEAFLAATLESMLHQTFEDFELILADNASTDGTEEICRSYEARDQRVRYHRHAQDRGASWNHNYVLAAAVGEYFRWNAHDDLCAPDYLLKCVDVLDRDPSIIVCHSKTMWIDEAGNPTGVFKLALDTGSVRPHVRFRELILHPHWCYDVFGLMRAAVLRRTPGIGHFSAADRTLLARLGLLGRFHEIPEYLFFYREHPGQSTRVFATRYRRARWFDPALAGQVVFPDWRILAEYAQAVWQTPLGWPDRAWCHAHLARWIITDRNWARMAKDVVRACRFPLRSRRARDQQGSQVS
jgi:glycosyltransferase involved in cell wall biosynthesis